MGILTVLTSQGCLKYKNKMHIKELAMNSYVIHFSFFSSLSFSFSLAWDFMMELEI